MKDRRGSASAVNGSMGCFAAAYVSNGGNVSSSTDEATYPAPNSNAAIAAAFVAVAESPPPELLESSVSLVDDAAFAILAPDASFRLHIC